MSSLAERWSAPDGINRGKEKEEILFFNLTSHNDVDESVVGRAERTPFGAKFFSFFSKVDQAQRVFSNQLGRFVKI